MKKIGILTLYDNNNYGNRLQNYAVQEVLKKLNYDSETIINKTYDGENRNFKYFLEIFSLKKVTEKIQSIYTKKIVSKKNKKIIEERKNNFRSFNENIKFFKDVINNNTDLKNVEQSFDYFSVGSDQVWNPYSTLVKDINFLKFSPREKNVSFSASFGVSEIPERLHKKYEEGLNNFKSISVREDAGKKIVESLSKNSATVLLDPTMMLSQEKWLSVSKKAEGLPERYITTLFLGKISGKRKKLIYNIMSQYNLKLVNLNDIKNPTYFKYGPAEFIDVIKNASLVLTDSFHVTVFSIMLNTPFYVLKRESATKSMNSRIETLLSKFNYNDRIIDVNSTNINLECGFFNVKSILEEERKKTMQFLQNCFHGEN